jgi:hypothetical protein
MSLDEGMSLIVVPFVSELVKVKLIPCLTVST